MLKIKHDQSLSHTATAVHGHSHKSNLIATHVQLQGSDSIELGRRLEIMVQNKSFNPVPGFPLVRLEMEEFYCNNATHKQNIPTAEPAQPSTRPIRCKALQAQKSASWMTMQRLTKKVAEHKQVIQLLGAKMRQMDEQMALEELLQVAEQDQHLPIDDLLQVEDDQDGAYGRSLTRHLQTVKACAKAVEGAKICSITAWHKLIDKPDLRWQLCPATVVVTRGETCSSHCAKFGLQCSRAQRNLRNSCRPDARHTQQSIANNGCDQRLSSQVCECGVPVAKDIGSVASWATKKPAACINFPTAQTDLRPCGQFMAAVAAGNTAICTVSCNSALTRLVHSCRFRRFPPTNQRMTHAVREKCHSAIHQSVPIANTPAISSSLSSSAATGALSHVNPRTAWQSTAAMWSKVHVTLAELKAAKCDRAKRLKVDTAFLQQAKVSHEAWCRLLTQQCRGDDGHIYIAGE
jgi:hypothetical protein